MDPLYKKRPTSKRFLPSQGQKCPPSLDLELDLTPPHFEHFLVLQRTPMMSIQPAL